MLINCRPIDINVLERMHPHRNHASRMPMSVRQITPRRTLIKSRVCDPLGRPEINNDARTIIGGGGAASRAFIVALPRNYYFKRNARLITR